MKIDTIYTNLYQILQSQRPKFHHGSCKFLASSSVNGGITFDQKLLDAENNALEYILDGFAGLIDLVVEYFFCY